MAQRFSNKVAIVTGAAGGIGLAVVKRLHEDGASVVAVDVQADKIAAAAAQFADGRVIGVAADVSTEAGCESYVAAAVKHFGGVHLFHNNAGILEKQQMPIMDMPVAEFDRVHAVNVRGVFLGLKYVMRQMVAQGGGGAIVNTASIAALRARAEAAVYGSSKRAVVGLSNSAAAEGGKHRIRVNAICPGPVDTPMTQGTGPKSDSLTAQFSTQPMNRYAQPQEIANFVCYLLSDEASYQTGGVYTIDGGTIL